MTAEEWVDKNGQLVTDTETEIVPVREALITAFQAGQQEQISPEEAQKLANKKLRDINADLVKKLSSRIFSEKPQQAQQKHVNPAQGFYGMPVKGDDDPDSWSPYEQAIRKAYRLPLLISPYQYNNLQSACQCLESWIKDPELAASAIKDFLKSNPRSKLPFFADDFGAWMRSLRE